MRNTSTSPASPLSPTRWPNPPEAFVAWRSALVAAGTVVSALVPAFLGAAIWAAATMRAAGAPRGVLPTVPVPVQLALAFASDLPVACFLLVVLPWLARARLRDLGIGRPRLRDLGVGLAGAIGMWLVVEPSALLIQAITHRSTTEAAIALLRGVHGPLQTFAFVAIGAVVAPIAEELAFRAFLFRAIERYLPFWPAALLSGLCFGVVHASRPEEIVGLGIPLALGGTLLAGIYTRTRSLWANVVAHASFNSVSLVAVFVFHQKP